MIDVTTVVEIAQPVPEVFAFVADQTNAPQWQTDHHEVRRLTDGPIGVGSEHEFVRNVRGTPIRLAEPLCGLRAWPASYRTEASQSAGTVLTSRMEFRVRGPLSLLEPVLARLLAKDSRRDEQRLKSLLEHRDPSARA